jgi:hypothetical protein
MYLLQHIRLRYKTHTLYFLLFTGRNALTYPSASTSYLLPTILQTFIMEKEHEISFLNSHVLESANHKVIVLLDRSPKFAVPTSAAVSKSQILFKNTTIGPH